jgi:hypothetical protein
VQRDDARQSNENIQPGAIADAERTIRHSWPRPALSGAFGDENGSG